ncbi:MAG: hypothetical protein LBR26_09570 [Prevotella sp.]|jgi:hypothetical protein|nr:hypothetical protein [Prevotella sp.]
MKKKLPYTIEVENGSRFSVQLVSPSVYVGRSKKDVPDEVVFLVEDIDPKKDLTKDGDLIIQVSLEEARGLAEELLKITNADK